MAAKIDDRGRLKIPSDFRRILEDSYGVDVFITSVGGESALLYPLEVWAAIERRLAALPATDRTKERYVRRVSYFGQQGRLDSQGRIVVPPLLRESAQIEGEVVVCGSLDHLVIWNHGVFLKSLEEEPFTEADFQTLSDRGI